MAISTSPNAAPVTETSTTLQNAAVATGNGTALALTLNVKDVLLTFTGASTPNLTAEIELSYDGGSTYLAGYAQTMVDTTVVLATTIAVGATVQRFVWPKPPGATHLRTRISAAVTGSVTVVAIARTLG